MDPSLAAGREALLQRRPQDAARIYAARVEQEPADHEARYGLASAMIALGERDAAAEAMRDARILHGLAVARAAGADVPKLKTDPDYANNIATRLYGQGAVAVASVVWELALGAGRVDAQTLGAYGLSLQHQGRTDEAANVFRAVGDNFDAPDLHQFAVYAEIFGEDGERRHAAEAQAWCATYAQAAVPAPHRNRSLAGRRLKVGYVAPGFAGNQLRQFITPILESHDRKAVEVTLYPTDAASESGWPSWIKVRPIGRLSDADAAACIRQDGIDVLNDCWGHTAGSRLRVFAYKPAPVQVSWINFVQTTGLPQMDYVLHAASEAPTGLESFFNEIIWPVGPVFTPFRAAGGRLPPSPTPAASTGAVTFGSFNHPAKVSPMARAAWGELLRRKPEARLLLKYRYFSDPVLQRMIQAEFLGYGVEPERVVFEGHTTGDDYFKAFQAVDLMLDGWPAPGSTTTLEALSNGVPVLAMAGAEPNICGAYSRSILEAVGLRELVTQTPQDFIARALELTSDIDALDRLRARVRPGFDGSAICDEVGFTRGLEAAFTGMFERWRKNAVGPRAAVG